jgi:ABC-2 type transport system permease protein
MAELRLLTRIRWSQVRNHLGGRGVLGVIRRHSLLKIAVIALSGLAFWWGLFFLFLDGFKFLGTMADFKPVVLELLFALFFAALTLMLTFSNGIISFSSLFRSSETDFLFASPLSPQSIYLYKLIEDLVFSSWALFFLGLPLLFAYGRDGAAPWYFYPWSLAFLGAFVWIPAGIGSAAALIIGTYFSRKPKRVAAGLAALVALGFLVWAIRSYPAFQLGGRAYAAWMRDVLGRFSWTQNPLLPSQWIAGGMLKAGRGELKDALFYFLLIVSNSLLVLTACYWLAARIYLSGYRNFQSASRRRKLNPSSTLDRVTLALLFWLPPRIRAMVLKDIKTFRRDAVQWSQALIFFGLIGVYVMNLRVLNYHVQRIGFKNMVAFLNLTATSLTLATFTSRFVFPLLSLEGRRFWVLGLAPIRRNDLLMSKFTFAFGGCFLVSAVLMVSSDLMLRVPKLITVLHLFAVLVISAGVSGLSVGLGAIHANLREDNPARIVSGFGGTLNLVLSMLFVGTVVALLAIPCHLYLVRGVLTEGPFRLWLTLSVAVAAALGGICCWVPLVLGKRALERMET